MSLLKLGFIKVRLILQRIVEDDMLIFTVGAGSANKLCILARIS